ncbi:MAG: glycogen synthase [Desulfatibacillaceae bacterium]
MMDAPRILFVTPEVTYLPEGMGPAAPFISAKAGGMADVSAGLVGALYEAGADIHVALPDFRAIYNRQLPEHGQRSFQTVVRNVPDHRIHFAQDSAFFRQANVYSGDFSRNTRMSLAFQREVINHVLPGVRPDLVHCNDWTTALVPAMARRLGIPSLFTIHNLLSYRLPLAEVDNHGLDTGEFWPYLYYDAIPAGFDDALKNRWLDTLASGVFASHFINTVSHTFLHELTRGQHGSVDPAIVRVVADKLRAGCAVGIPNAPDPSFDPARDDSLAARYGPDDNGEGKAANKLALQDRLGLTRDSRAPLFFWPSRLDPAQKGCHLLEGLLPDFLDIHGEYNAQVAFVADGPHQDRFRQLARDPATEGRVAVADFDDGLSRLAFAGSDFVLMPSAYEPCGLPQMIGARYGALPVAYDTGGLHDTVTHFSPDHGSGNGFLFRHFDSPGLAWAMGEAMEFFRLPGSRRGAVVARVMREAREDFDFRNTARQYMDLYERMLDRPLVQPKDS